MNNYQEFRENVESVSKEEGKIILESRESQLDKLLLVLKPEGQ